MKALLNISTAAFLFSALSLSACSASDLDPKDPDKKTGGPGADDPDNPEPGTGGITDGPIKIEKVDRSTTCAESSLAKAGLRRLTAKEYQSTIQALFPEITEQWAGVAMGVDPVGYSGFTNDARNLLVGPQTVEEIYKTALSVATLVSSSDTLAKILPCAVDAADAACAGAFVDAYGEKLYRRPLEGAERDQLVAHYTSVADKSDFTMGMKWMLVALFQSPQFVYRTELGDDGGKLSAEEIATQLAFVFSGRPASADLLARARAGDLADPAVRVEEAKKLLGTPEGRAVIEDFFEQWAEYLEVRVSSKDGIDNFNDIRESMALETRKFLDYIVFESGGNVKDLLTAPYTFLDSLLAAHYGFGSVTDGFEKTDRPAGKGLGILAQGSFLSAKAHPDLTSPVFRGIFVYEKLLCGIRPEIPPSLVVPAITEAQGFNTTRERFEVVHGTPECRSCHQVFEPFGFGLEDFDAAGRFRDMEGDYPINALATSSISGSDDIEFDGLNGLAIKLAAEDKVTNCVSGQLASFAYSGGSGEACLAEESRARLLKGDSGILGYFAELAGAPSMIQRKR